MAEGARRKLARHDDVRAPGRAQYSPPEHLWGDRHGGVGRRLVRVPVALVYSSAKAGLVHFTRCAAAALAPKGIRIATVCPGFVDMPMVADSRQYICDNFGELLTADMVVNEVEAFLDDSSPECTGAVRVLLQEGCAFDWEPPAPPSSVKVPALPEPGASTTRHIDIKTL